MKRARPWMERDDMYRVAIFLCVLIAVSALSLVLFGRW